MIVVYSIFLVVKLLMNNYLFYHEFCDALYYVAVNFSWYKIITWKNILFHHSDLHRIK